MGESDSQPQRTPSSSSSSTPPIHPASVQDNPLPEKRKLSCMVGYFIYIPLFELAVFKGTLLLFNIHSLADSLWILLLIAALLVFMVLAGLLDDTLFTLALAILIFILLPGSHLFVNFFLENYTVLMLHLWLPLYFCRQQFIKK